MNKYNKMITLGVLSISFFLTMESFAYEHNATKIEKNTISYNKKIVATVNEVPIYEKKLNEFVKKQLKKDMKFKSSGANSLDVKIVRKKVLNKLIDNELLIQASQNIKINDIEKNIDKKIEEIKKRFGSVERYKRYLPRKMSDKEFRDFLKKKIIVREYLKKEGVVDPDIPEDEIKKFYNSKKSNFRSPDLIKASQILLLVKATDSEEKKKKILEKAKEIRQMLVNGEDFAKVAKKYSQSSEANATGGKLGILRKGYMPKEFDKVAFSMKVGEISQPVKTKFGYHIIKVTDKHEAKIASYEKSKNFIKKYLQERVTINKMKALLEKLRKRAKIKITE